MVNRMLLALAALWLAFLWVVAMALLLALCFIPFVAAVSLVSWLAGSLGGCP